MAEGAPHLTLDTDLEASPARVVASGEIDAATAPQLGDVLDSLPAGTAIALDLGKVHFIDSSGLRVIVAARRDLEAAGGSLTVAAASDAVERLFSMTGLEGLIGA